MKNTKHEKCQLLPWLEHTQIQIVALCQISARWGKENGAIGKVVCGVEGERGKGITKP